ncbi:hypothetical protein HYV80_04100, partial [Candidatus Woesearchaeota archaeon]|nr:hypothetical protein [Candidatus Woesearchaeota archaeon]
MKDITTIKLKKSTVELLNKFKVHPRQPYEEIVFELADKKLKEKKKFDKKGNVNFGIFMSFIIITSIFSGLLLWKYTSIFGFVIKTQIENYEDVLNLEINANTTYDWIPQNQGLLKSIKLSGNIKENSTAKVWLEKDDKRYLIFDSTLLNFKDKYFGDIIGFVVKDEKGEEKDKDDKNKEDKNKDEDDEEINETQQNITKIIEINLEYNKDSLFDEDNDGAESVNGVVDLNVEGSNFNWAVDESKLCTKWETYSLDEDKATTICYGNEQCCNFLG